MLHAIHTRLLASALAIGLLAAAMPVGGSADAAGFPRLFGTSEVRSTKLKPFVKWTGMLDRHFKQADMDHGDCTEAEFNRCHLDAWAKFIEGQRGQPRMAQLKAVNKFFNEAPYILDIRNWGVDDYWATPLQFFERDGDCEDYAITKYMSLRALGFSVEDMRVAVVQDLNLGIAHAVLVVYLDGNGYILDNQIEQVVLHSEVHHYRPYYTINENAWWLHKS